MGQLYVYDPWPTAVDTMGLCGPLVPTKATCTQEKNGDFRLDIEHPIDGLGKWQHLMPGNLIKADVPLRTMPAFFVGLSTVLYRAVVKDVARSSRVVLSSSYAAHKITLETLPAGTEVFIMHKLMLSPYYANVVWPGGSGWMYLNSLTELETINIASPDATTIENYVPSPRTRKQLFRISAIKQTNSGVSVEARHVFYDAASNLTTAAAGEKEMYYALEHIANGEHNFSLLNYVDIDYLSNFPATNKKDVPAYTRVSPVEAIMSPDSGVCALWNGELLRDNWRAAILTSAGMDRGFCVEYAKNMRGVMYTVNMSGVQSGIIPVGQTSKGKPLVVPDGTYTIDGASVTVLLHAVNSPAHTYPIPYLGVLDLGASVKAAGTSDEQKLVAYTKLIRAALKKFTDEHCDLPEVTLFVDFINLGDTEEYAQYRDLQKLFLYDVVRVKHPRLGIDVTTQVNKTVWDCLLDCYDSIELGSVRKNYARSKLAGWMIPGLDSLKAYVDTIAEQI